MKSARLHLFQSPIFLAVVLLLGVGVVQVYSSSYIYATETFGQGLMFFRKQLVFAGLSIASLFVVSQIPLPILRRWAWVFWVFSVVAIVLTLIPGVGVKVGGARRWIELPLGFRLEPSEFLKVSLSVILASLFVRSETLLRSLHWSWLLLLTLLPFALVLLQPDFGSFTLMALTSFVFLFVFGLRARVILVSLLLAIPSFYILVMRVPYRRARVLAFMDPWADPDAKGFQVIQSMMSFSSGGLTGVGLGQGQGKLFFLPEAHTDFTLAVLGEETGFIGFLIVMGLYGLLILRGVQIAVRSEERFNRALAVGLTSIFSLNVFVNVGVVLGLLPTKGLTLPFLSYGGSSAVAMGVLFGLLINLERHLPSRDVVIKSNAHVRV